jgi:hypothetical protein
VPKYTMPHKRSNMETILQNSTFYSNPTSHDTLSREDCSLKGSHKKWEINPCQQMHKSLPRYKRYKKQGNMISPKVHNSLTTGSKDIKGMKCQTKYPKE